MQAMRNILDRFGRLGLVSFLVLLMLIGCRDWPHFDYAASPTQGILESESDGDTETVQNLGEVHGDVIIYGVIDGSVYVPTVQDDAPFGLPGWYGGDIDWYQFSLHDARTLQLLLTWVASDAQLDMYFFEASPDTGELSLLDYQDEAGVSEQVLSVDTLDPDTVYVVAVAGRQGTNVEYNLLLGFSS
jgi:hypothetical protein